MFKPVRLHFVAILSMLALGLFAQSKPGIEHITSNNGLSHNTIRYILQDKTGFMWFASLNGLNRFDGVNIRTFNPESKNPNSLSSGKIKKLFLDSYGHVWVRTYSDIMHCYDPQTENFIEISDNPADRFIKHNFFYEDKQGAIWLGSVADGCDKIEFGNKSVHKTSFTTKSKVPLPSNTVNDVFQDSKSNIWIATAKGYIQLLKNTLISKSSTSGAYVKSFELDSKVYIISGKGNFDVYDLNKKSFSIRKAPFAINSIVQANLMGNNIVFSDGKSCYYYDTKADKFAAGSQLFGENLTGNVLFTTDGKGNVLTFNFSGNVWVWLNKYQKIVKLNVIPSSVLHLIDEERFQFQCDAYDNLWISTFGNGLFSYHISSKQLTHYTHTLNNSGIASNYLLALYLDKNENLWVGTENMGVNKLSFNNRNVLMLLPDAENKFHDGNVIRAFLEDSRGNIWVSTKAGNLYMYDNTLQTKKTVYENKFNVYTMLEDKNGSIWLGTKKDGLIELKNGKLSGAVQYQKTASKQSLNNNTVFSIAQDKKGRIWAATFGGGLCVKTGTGNENIFRTFFDNDEWLRFVRYVFVDKQGDLWVATTNGVFRFNPDAILRNKNAFRHYTFTSESENCLSNPEVRFIFQDSKDRIWLATSGGGVNMFEGETKDGNGIFKIFNNKLGMANDNTMAIQEDKNGYLWISTENGLHKLNPETDIFQYYRFSDNFSANLFSETACLTCRNGKMLWGSLNGFYAFHPTKLNEQKKISNHVVLTGFSVFDQPASVGSKKATLKQSVTFSDQIELNASDKVFHIEFSNLNFDNPEANQYMYMLENYEKRWNVSGATNIATYRNVPPGTYTFLVKGLNEKGIWDDKYTALEIVIHPPFWLSKIAFLFYFALLVALIYFAINLIKKFNDLNNAVAVERQLTNYKLRFFTNISHEFRTPLTLIKGSVDTLTELRRKMAEPLQHLVDDLDRNTSHLMRLIDQLLEFRKLQNNKQKLNLRKTNLNEFLSQIFESYSNVAEKMNIEYKFQHADADIEMFIDQNKLDKIVFNLLSNAFKFTRRGGKITLSAELNPETNFVAIAVSDNGIGIPKEKQNMLFSRFMQANFSEKGTGIGLSLVNEFTALHKGNVYFAENIGGGSIFTVEIPVSTEWYADDDFLTEDIVVTTENNEQQTVHISEFFDENEDMLLNLLPNIPVGGKHYKILVIDDNDDIRRFLYDRLSPYFEIITAEDGDTGFAKSTEYDPDLIICDVMMPGMNGFELTKRLKDDFATCHIPVILLTAYTADEHQTEGIVAGAEAYISKPFSMKDLLLQINKLLEKKEKLHQHFSSNNTVSELIDENKLEIPDRESHFLMMVEEILDANLTDPEFTVDDFAAKAKTGRTLFFKKVKFLTGYSPNELIRVRRMTKAAELLRTFQYNVSEVSYKVGINDPFYFSKCFKSQFGCSPTQYINKK